MTFRHRTFRHNHFVTQTYRHTDISSQRPFVTRTFCHRSFGYVLYLQPKFGVLLQHPIRQSKIFRPKIMKLLRNFPGSMIRRFHITKTKCSRKSRKDLEYSFFGVRTLTHRSVAHRRDADWQLLTGQLLTRTVTHRKIAQPDSYSPGQLLTG